MKPIIIAIAGSSCAGKDTLMWRLYWEFSQMPYLIVFPDVYYIISTTTRPPRKNEENHKDYHFITTEKFQELIDRKCFLEYTEFRGWKYGTDLLNICNKPDAINIGVFNLQGIDNLNKQDQFIIIPIYLKVNWRERLRRSIKREGKLTFEMIRRMFTDYKDFKHPYQILNQSGNLLCYTKNYDIKDVMQDIMGQIKKYQTS